MLRKVLLMSSCAESGSDVIAVHCMEMNSVRPLSAFKGSPGQPRFIMISDVVSYYRLCIFSNRSVFMIQPALSVH